MIFQNFITGPNTASPVNLVTVAQTAMSATPLALKKRVCHALQRRVKPTTVMQFDYPDTLLAPGIDEQDEIAWCKAAGTELIYYVGAKMLPATRAERRKVLERYRGAGTVIFDQVADDEADSPEADLLQQALSIGLNVGLEANRDQDWIRTLLARYGPRITINGQWWLWEGLRGRFTTDDVKALGGKPLVTVSLFAADNDAQRAMDADPAAFAEFKTGKACEWAKEADVMIRLSAAFTPAQLARLVAAGGLNP